MRERRLSSPAITVMLICCACLQSSTPGGAGMRPLEARAVSDETALWMLKHARLRLSGASRQAQEMVASAPREISQPRQAILFVSIFAAGCAVCPRPSYATGGSLLAALNAALDMMTASIISSDPEGLRRRPEPARIQIDLLDGGLIPLDKGAIDWRTPKGSISTAAELIEAGLDGIALEADGRAFYLLPLEMIYRQLLDENPGSQSAGDLLDRIADHLGLAPQSWRSPGAKLSRFRTISFVEDASRGAALRNVRGSVQEGEPDRARLLAAARAGGDYLLRMQQPDGKFFYYYSPLDDRASSSAYNILRHAGSAFSLFDLYAATRDARYLESARRAVGFLETRFRQVKGRQAIYVIDNDGKAKLGANGLALLALTRQMELDPKSADRESAIRLANLILELQRKDGSFESYYKVRGDEPSGSVSLYYPGEAMFGLARLYNLTGERRLLEAARRGASYYIDSQRAMSELPPDAWLIQALEALYRIGGEQRYAAHALALAEAMAGAQYTEKDTQGYAGAFKPGLPRSTPAAARSEGMVAAYRIARSINDTRAAKLGAALKSAARFQLSQQFDADNSFFLPNPGRAAGGFRASLTSMQVRIDYVQHNISSLLGVAETLH